MKLTNEEACFFDLITMCGYQVEVNSKKAVISKDDFRVEFDKKELQHVIPLVMVDVEVRHF